MSRGSTTPLRQLSTVGALVADQPQVEPQPLLVGPTTAREFNTLGERLIPKGCFRMEDVRFEFDSSFPGPQVKDDMPILADLIERHSLVVGEPEQTIPPPLSIFGHADPVGDDDYNKQLSGRRALAVYGMLVRDVEIWEELFTRPQGGDQWGTRQIQAMLETVGHAPGPIDGESGPQTTDAIKAFQREKGLAADGDAGPQTRRALYRAYMDELCGSRLELDKNRHFLARHEDGSGLKGDVQGCGEFNPVLMFSREEQEAFEQAADKTGRNAENAPNRRVMILLFAPGRKVKPEAWPCPRAKEGVAACKKRFFVDSDQRRTFQEERREFDQTRDTFACSFYQMVSDDSPCHKFDIASDLDAPVYFCAVAPSAPIFSAPHPNAAIIGQLNSGVLVRVVEEKYSEDAFFIRFDRVDSSQEESSYYLIRRRDPRDEWLCVSSKGELHAFWSNNRAESLFAPSGSLDDRLSSLPLDV